MNKRHERTLNAIFRTPVPKTLKWRQIESLLVACGAKTIEGRGSRVRFELNGVTATFHRPHNQKEARPYQVKDARRFLERAGIIP
ncbi:MAG: type II toxin-antitoxin system HicA family toxin [Candidatus Poribacteria bacterium]|nr:type II toxin-antitoxin system HicA family toxin [Candidatus Poribacteria bacterium]MDE0314375.1 type II toxin-antitoxin system HicA family toxin [Candidatus Poribacteria bacterium]